MEKEAKLIKERIKAIFNNWSDRTVDKNDALYLADDETVLFDVGNLIDIGWSTQKIRLKKDFSTLEKFQIVPNDDVIVNEHGDFAWATCTWWADGKPKSGSSFKLNGRGTFVFVRREGEWLAVHDHMSVPNGISTVI
jgi:ketosteroid isomerase-like protein